MYEFRIAFLIDMFVTLSVFGDTVILIPTEKMTPATVYNVLTTASGIDTQVYIEIPVAANIDINKYINILLITETKI